MTRTNLQRSWFVAPPLGGEWAILWIFVSLPVAVAIRRSMDCPDVVGDCCTPFFMFVLVSAVLLGTRAAIASTAVSLAVSLLLFSSTSNHAVPMAMPADGEAGGIVMFLLYCALVIGGVAFVRRSFQRLARISQDNELSSGVIFSLEEGYAWASWPGGAAPVRLGPEAEVTPMMNDFIAQVQLGRRLNGKSEAGGGDLQPSDEPVALL